MPFQTKVNYNWPEGFPGEIASANPHRSVISPSIAYRAGTAGVTIAAFAWVQADGETVANKPASGTPKPDGFVYRNQQGLTTQYLQESTMTVPGGFMITLAEGGDFFAISGTDAERGQAVYASTTDGTIKTSAPGSAPSGTVDTGWVVSKGATAGTPIIITGPMQPTKADTPAPTVGGGSQSTTGGDK